MADDFDRSIGGLIAVAMQSTMVAFVVAIAALAFASLTFSTAYYFVEDSGDIIDVAVFTLLMGVPLSFMLLWGIPIALFQVFCFYTILYEDGNRPQHAVYLFFSQMVTACICNGSTDSEWSPNLKALLLSVFVCGLPFAIYWIKAWPKRRETGR